jgi:hypothetical protein
LLTLTACAGRAPQLTPLVHAADTKVSCSDIDAETRRNTERISALATEQNWKMGQNAVAGIVGFMVWPAWLGLDLQNAAGQEAYALSQRNEHLMALSGERCRPTAQTAQLDPTPDHSSALASNAEIAASLLGR